MRAPLLLATAALGLSACTSYTAIAPDEQAVVERDLSGRDANKFLKLSFYVTPFFGDAAKKLLTSVPPDEVRMLNEINGAPLNPGAVEATLPVGTRVHILKVEFPTSWVVGGRVPYTPRTRPWLYLAIEGQPKDQELILVLRQGMKSRDEFLAEVDRFLAREDPERILSQWSDGVRLAVREKNALVDMPAEALEMAWGYPELKQISYDGQVKKEKWVYPGERRVALLSDGRVTQLDDRH
jgi:hypothetical protein